MDDITIKEHIAAMAEERATRLQNEVIHVREFNAEVTRRLDQRIDYEAKLNNERDKRYAERFAAQEAATLYQRQVTNEFREQLRDQAERFISRTEALARAQANADKIDSLATRIDRTEGRSGGLDAGWKILIAVVGLIATIAGLIALLRH